MLWRRLVFVADILSAFWQLPVEEEHIERTACGARHIHVSIKGTYLNFAS